MTSIVPTFILRLVGQAPDQKEAEKQFRKSLEQHEESEKELDDILGSLQDINKKAKRNIELNKTILPTRSDMTPVPGSGTGG